MEDENFSVLMQDLQVSKLRNLSRGKAHDCLLDPDPLFRITDPLKREKEKKGNKKERQRETHAWQGKETGVASRPCIFLRIRKRIRDEGGERPMPILLRIGKGIREEVGGKPMRLLVSRVADP